MTRATALAGAGAALCMVLLAVPAAAQEPAAWGEDLVFHTFSIAAVDPATGESGVAVTTRVPCVGNGVPWVRAGVGAVATQAFTRTAYGTELLDRIERGQTPSQALAEALALDTLALRRQVGVVAMDGSSAQHTGTGTSAWAGHRSGPNYTVQGNLLVGPEVVEAVAATFEASHGSPRHLADRLIDALAAGQKAGGDARKGRLQSASVVVADPRPGRSRRADGQTAHINVCEHPTPVAELRRIYDGISQTLGYRDLHLFQGNDVRQLKVILTQLGYLAPDSDDPLDVSSEFDSATVDAVERFRGESGLSTRQNGSPPGLVDGQAVDALWQALEDAGNADAVRALLLEMTSVRR